MAGDASKIISSISTDTRTIKAGDFYVPLKGVNFDGHDFIGEAIAKGVSGILVSKIVGAGFPRPPAGAAGSDWKVLL